jgi:hypothetical protein
MIEKGQKYNSVPRCGNGKSKERVCWPACPFKLGKSFKLIARQIAKDDPVVRANAHSNPMLDGCCIFSLGRIASQRTRALTIRLSPMA